MEVVQLTESKRSVSLPVPRESFKNLAATCETSEKTILAIVAGLELSMRRDDRVSVVARLSAELEFCARTYCGADVSADEETLDESVSFILKRFAQLGVSEVREAFSMAAAGDLGKLDIRAYYGRFSLVVLGEVLKSYLVFREKAVRELRKAEQEAENAAREAERKMRLSECSVQHENWCKSKIADWIEGSLPKYDQIPIPVYDYLTETGELNLTLEAKLELMERAKSLTMSSFVSDLNAESNEFRARSIRQVIDNARKDAGSDLFVARQKVVARQLAVLDYLTFHKI